MTQSNSLLSLSSSLLSSRVLLIMFLFLSSITSNDAFASWMTNDFCDRPLIVNEIIMNQPVIRSDERVLLMERLIKNEHTNQLESVQIMNPGEYVNADQVKVMISDLNPASQENEFVFEIQGNVDEPKDNGNKAVFVNGGCQGRRSTKNGAIIDLSKATGPVTIVAGWARGHEEVKLTPSFVLYPKGQLPSSTGEESLDAADSSNTEAIANSNTAVAAADANGDVNNRSEEGNEASIEESKSKSATVMHPLGKHKLAAAARKHVIDEQKAAQLADLAKKGKEKAKKSIEEKAKVKEAKKVMKLQKFLLEEKTESNDVEEGEEVNSSEQAKLSEEFANARKAMQADTIPRSEFSSRRKKNAHLNTKPVDEKVSMALRGADLSTELLPLHSHKSRYYMGVFYIVCVILVYVLFKMFPANKFRVRKIVGRMQGQDVSK